MFTHYYTEGVILAKRAVKDADEIITVYTRDFGKVDLIGKSIKKNGSKLKMNTSLFALVEIGFIQGKSCNTLTDARLISSFRNAKKDLGKLSLFYRMSETILSLVHGEEKDENIFLLISQSLRRIDSFKISKNKLKLFYCFFSFNLLYFLGYKLYIKECASCGNKVEGDCYFNPREGGVVCKNCFLKEPIGIYLEEIDLLRSFLENDIRNVKEQDSKIFVDILENYLNYIPENSGKQ